MISTAFFPRAEVLREALCEVLLGVLRLLVARDLGCELELEDLGYVPGGSGGRRSGDGGGGEGGGGDGIGGGGDGIGGGGEGGGGGDAEAARTLRRMERAVLRAAKARYARTKRGREET